ncbi:MAG: hypothetical protein ACJ754_14190 [Pyrinomonadaceae bacterium]
MSPEARRVYAADWFMRAAAIPCSAVLAAVCAAEAPDSVPEFLLKFLIILAGPAVIAGGWGAALGASILDPAATRSAGRATLRGLAVALASFVTYMFVLYFFLGVLGFDGRGDSFKLFIVVLFYGTTFVGWLVAAVGALAGAQLYKRRESPDAVRA